MALAVFAASNAVGLTVAGRMSDRVGRRPFIIGGLVVSGIATAVTGFATDLPTLVVLSVVAGFGAGALNPAQQASLADIVGRERNGGPALAAFQMSADTGAIIGPILAGVLIDYGSYPLAFGTTGLITLLAVHPVAARPRDARRAARGAHPGCRSAHRRRRHRGHRRRELARGLRPGCSGGRGGQRVLHRGLDRSEHGVAPGQHVDDGLGVGELLATFAGGPLRRVRPGRPVADALGVETDGPAGRHRARQVVTLRHDEHPVDAEDARGPGARVIGVAPGEVAHDGIRRNPVRGEPVTHGGGLVVAGDPVVTGDEDDLRPPRRVERPGDLEPAGEDAEGLPSGFRPAPSTRATGALGASTRSCTWPRDARLTQAHGPRTTTATRVRAPTPTSTHHRRRNHTARRVVGGRVGAGGHDGRLAAGAKQAWGTGEGAARVDHGPFASGRRTHHPCGRGTHHHRPSHLGGHHHRFAASLPALTVLDRQVDTLLALG